MAHGCWDIAIMRRGRARRRRSTARPGDGSNSTNGGATGGCGIIVAIITGWRARNLADAARVPGGVIRETELVQDCWRFDHVRQRCCSIAWT
jgi:hypothetical protein